MTKSATRVAADKVTFTQTEVTAKDTAATLAVHKRVAKALRLAEYVNLFDVNHLDIKIRALEKYLQRKGSEANNRQDSLREARTVHLEQVWQVPGLD